MLQKNIRILFFLLLISLGNIIQAQVSGSISGKIRTVNDMPADYITVELRESNQSTVTDAKGNFSFYFVDPGSYTLEYSLEGLESKTIPVQVNSGEVTNVGTLVLNENDVTLEPLIVNARRLNQFSQKETPYVTRLPIKNINTPQTYSIVTNELINEQISTDLPSALKSITGGGYVEANTGAVSIYARGFRTDSRVKNGLLQFHRARVVIENQNIERIEVIKGPSAVNYGAGFYGGLVNLVTKKPLNIDKLDVAYHLGSFGLHRATVDYNKSFDGEYGLRINSAYHTENGFQEKGSEIRQHFFIAPVFSYKPSDKFELTIGGEFLNGKRNQNFARATGKNVTVSSWDALGWDYNNSYTNKDVASDVGSVLLQGEVNYKFIPHWSSKTAVSYQNFKAEGPYIRLVAESDNKFSRQFLSFEPEKGGSTNIRQDFVGTYKFSDVENNTMIGLSYFSDFWNYTQKRAKSRGVFSVIDKFDVDKNPTLQDLTMSLLNSIDTNSVDIKSGSNTLSGYFSNATTFNDKVTVLGGLRYDNFKNDATITNGKEKKDKYNQGKLSYNLGVTLNPWNDQMSIFGNYMNGYNNSAPGFNVAGKIQNFDPEEAQQWETGLKFNLWNRKLISTISYYNIKINNAVLTYRTPNLVYKAQDGKIKSKGFEVDLIANPFEGFNVVLGYTYNDAKNIKYSNPKAEGKRLTLTPETVANIWTSYKVLRGELKGLGFGIGANHMSEIYETRSDMNTFYAKPYTTIDGTVFYEKQRFNIGVKLNNITNKEYYNAYGMPQKPFNFVIKLSYKFL